MFREAKWLEIESKNMFKKKKGYDELIYNDSLILNSGIKYVQKMLLDNIYIYKYIYIYI